MPPRLTREEFEAYYRSPHWLAMRRRAFAVHGRWCRHCRATKGLQVHHRHYETLGHEDPRHDLEVLCEFCHDVADFARRDFGGDFAAALTYLHRVGNWS